MASIARICVVFDLGGVLLRPEGPAAELARVLGVDVEAERERRGAPELRLLRAARAAHPLRDALARLDHADGELVRRLTAP